MIRSLLLAVGLFAHLSAAETLLVPEQYPTIQAAVNAAIDGDEILISPGTYTSSGNEVVSLTNKQLTLRSLGSAEETILDGESQRRVIHIGGGNQGCTIEGLTITNGFTGGNANDGGGLFIGQSSQVTCMNCIFSENFARASGGAIGSGGGGGSPITALLTNCLFVSNSSGYGQPNYGSGGAIWGIQNLVANQCYFQNNTSDNGGALGVGLDATLDSCTFEQNFARQMGGGLLIQNGQDIGDVSITNCQFLNNECEGGRDGGGSWCNGDASFSNCYYEGNSAYEGSGAYNWKGAPSYTNCIFSGNYGTAIWNGDGGSAYAYPTIESCIIRNNLQGGWSGGGIFTFAGAPDIRNTIISNNAGPGLRVIYSGQSILNNTTVCGNTTQIEGAWTGTGNTIADICDDDADGVDNNSDNCPLYNPDQQDCNNNGVGDVCDLESGGEDLNQNQVLDECECIADVVPNGTVGFDDLLSVTSTWGDCSEPCPTDFIKDGTVSFTEVLYILNAWGPCSG